MYSERVTFVLSLSWDPRTNRELGLLEGGHVAGAKKEMLDGYLE